MTQLDMFTKSGRARVVGPAAPALRFNGSDYDPAIDNPRLSGQLARIFDLMIDGAWRTLDEIAAATSDPITSISAQLRHLRKPRFGAHVINKRPRHDRASGCWEYQLRVNPEWKGFRE